MGHYRNNGGVRLTVGTGFQPSRPVGAGKGAIRTAMANDSFNYSLVDRMGARSADKAMAGATMSVSAKTTQPTTSRLDDSPTPGLDAQQQSPIRYTTKQSRIAEQRAATEKSSLSGAFGQKAQAKAENLQGRKALYRDMQGGQVDFAQARERATSLGVDEKGWNTAVTRMEEVDTKPADMYGSPAKVETGIENANKPVMSAKTDGDARERESYFGKPQAKVSQNVDQFVIHKARLFDVILDPKG